MPDHHKSSELIKFDNYIDAVGDGASRSRSIIALLMTATIVAGLGLFNSLRKEHNWFSSRIDALHNVYHWIVFPDDPIKSAVAIHHSSPQPDTILHKVKPSKTIRYNTFHWAEFNALLVQNGIRLKGGVPDYVNLCFPKYLILPDSTINFSKIDKEALQRAVNTASMMNVTGRKELDALLLQFDRSRIENALLVKMPVLGVTFDVNWLSLVSAVSFSAILFLLFYSLSRERKNLRLIFKVAEERKINRLDFYQMLSMRQVLNVPQSINEYVFGLEAGRNKAEINFRRRVRNFTNRMGRYPLFTPVITWLLILTHDISTLSIGFSINPSLTIFSFGLSLVLGVVMLLLVRLCWREWTKIITIWDAEAEIIKKDHSDQQTMDKQFIWYTDPGSEFFTSEQCHITELFNQGARPEASIAQARVEPGVTTQRHSLQDTAEWYYILRGSGEMFVNNEPAGPVKTGDVVYIPANTAQQVANTGSEDLVFLCFCVPRFRPDAYNEVPE